MKHTVFIALGSNLGDRLKNLEAAIAAMMPAVHPVTCSSVYETPPWGYLDQPKFLNQVVRAETDLSPEELLDHLKGIEKQLGRVETFRNGPRKVIWISCFMMICFYLSRLKILILAFRKSVVLLPCSAGAGFAIRRSNNPGNVASEIQTELSGFLW
jgi:2-amino-4-hydroxy-6-hydroxymethyldihydropteridine diphosphokinase